MREKILFDEGWLFHKGDIPTPLPQVKDPMYLEAKTESKKRGPAAVHYNDSPGGCRNDMEYSSARWTMINLPHDYMVTEPVTESGNETLGFFEYVNGWYRKHFVVEETDRNKRLTLYFEGVASKCHVYLNGCELKSNIYGYSPFEVDITDYVKYGEDNVLAVYTYFDECEGWWYQGGGIYRHVHLIKTELLSVDLYGVYIAPVCEDGKWTAKLETTVRNDFFEEKEVSILTRLIDQDGNEIASCGTEGSISLRDVKTFTYETAVEDPVLWDLEHPYLYRVVTEITSGGELMDVYETRTGFRTITFDADKGCFVNGKHVFINGVCGHGDFGLTGKAVPDNVFRYKVKLLKEMGTTGYRCSHYPQQDALMDAFDEQGMLVMCEARWFHSTEDGKRQVIEHVKRDRNRPCVFMWSLGNEEPFHITDNGYRINKTLYYEVKKLDPYRAVTSAVDKSPDKATVYEFADIIGINYNHTLYDTVRSQYPNKAIYASENSCGSGTRGWYFDSNKYYRSAYDGDRSDYFIGTEHFRKYIAERPYIFGYFQWNGFEYRGESRWPGLHAASGSFDFTLQKKDLFYFNKSHFVTEPMIYLMPHWNYEGMEGEEIRVSVYTNCEEVELILNGKSICRKKLEKYAALDQMVPYEPGKIECIGYIDGKAVVSDSRETTGVPVRLKLRLDNAGDVKANGQDIAVITCYCEDAQGRVVPDADPFVRFHCNHLGTLVGTGSDPTDHVPVNVPNRQMFAGAIGVAIKTGKESGTLKVYAQSGTLKSAVLSIEI